MTNQSLLEFDRKHIWHPYTSATNPLPTFLVERAQGTRIYLQDGTELIDGMASWWCAIHGYNHPSMNQALEQQINKMSHVMFGGLTHEPAINLAKKLFDLCPDGLEHVFFADSGSVGVEVGIKMAIQYWQTQGQPKKNKLVSLRGGYHGDTFAAMSVCDPDTGMHHLFGDSVAQQIFVDRPSSRFDEEFDPNSLSDIRQTLANQHQEIAAFILEPIVQGAGGMWFYHPEVLREIRHLCDKYNVLLIADEIATGFGRTGKLFACEWANISPDIMIVGKALTGGYLSLSATLASSEVAHGISQNGGVFMHGPTFMGNPLACAAANQSIDLLMSSDWLASVQQIEASLNEQLEPAKSIKSVVDVRVLGAIGVIEMRAPVDVKWAQQQFTEMGVWIRPFGTRVYVMPPYLTSTAEIATLCQAMIVLAKRVESMR
jgi:adenosylmethionine-8-amino-7-oxononanoate aminotransferase